MLQNVLLLLCLSAAALLLVTSGTSYVRQWEIQTKDVIDDVNSNNRKTGIDATNTIDVDTLYESSPIKALVQKHGEEALLAARADRKRECGTLVSVSAIDCELCYSFVSFARYLVEKGSTQQEIVKFATSACIALKIEDERVCRAVVEEFKVFHTNFFKTYLYYLVKTFEVFMITQVKINMFTSIQIYK